MSSPHASMHPSRDPERAEYDLLNGKGKERIEPDLQPADPQQNAAPTIFGLPLKYVSLVTLAVQNAALALIMHYSRISTAPGESYSAASAVLMVELLKGSISLVVAFMRIDMYASSYPAGHSLWNPRVFLYRCRRLGKEIFRPDCWKLSIPAILYVIQNNLQFVAVSNLDAATFQVSYQMKILTTAAFSVVLLRKRLTSTKWLALLFLALGVGIVQIQNGSTSASSHPGMNPFIGFMAVVAACFTSGLAGVYFEMVLKNSQADLWVRNVQLSLFSLLPALAPIIFANATPSAPSLSLFTRLFENFGVWAWATVLTQVLGGLLTALVIKYADNILKGFATSLSIVISFLASMALFNFKLTASFILGATVVLAATWMYNQPDTPSSPTMASDGFYLREPTKPWWRRPIFCRRASSGIELGAVALSRRASTSSLSTPLSYSTPSGTRSYPGTPTEREATFLPHLLEKSLLGKRKEDDPTPLFVAPRRAASRIASYFQRSNSGSFIVPEGGEYALPQGYGPTPMSGFQPVSLSSPSTRPSSAFSSRPASAMGSVASLHELPEDHP